MRMLDFLKQVLPSQGYYCWVTIKNKRAVQGFVPVVEDLAKKIVEEDAKGIDVYFACSSFLQEGSRKAINVHSTKALWLDIDAGVGKPYGNAEEAADALDAFCQKSGLPDPLVVCSGNGIHAWWPLEKELSQKEWKDYAERLKLLAQAYGMAVDSSRTTDVASILRPPGTRNFKDAGNPRPVSVWEYEDRGGFAQGSILQRLDNDRVDVVANWDSIKPQDSDISLEKGYGDGERTQALTKLAGFLMGPAKNYSLADTIATLCAWNRLNMPPLPEEKVRSTCASIYKSEAKKREQATGGTGGLPKLPHGYTWDPRGRLLTSVPVKDSDEREEVVVTEFPLCLTSVTKKERTIDQAYMFSLWLPKEGWREFQVACSDFEGQSWKGHISKHGGAVILNDKLFKNYVHAADTHLRRQAMDTVRYQQYGWKDNGKSFLIGDTLFHDTGKVEKVFSSEELAFRTKQMVPTKGGSLEAWSAEANLLFGDSFIHFGYALIASFASVLLNFCMDKSDGGIVLSIVSKGSGRGKSKLLEASASVWGQLEALQITPRDTTNAKFSIITTLSHLPVLMDEWNERDPNVLANFIKQYTVGHDKNRAQRDGSVQSKPAEYKNLLMTTSNSSLLEIVGASNDEGAIARIVEIEAPDMGGETFRRLGQLTTRMLSNAGYAGREFIYQIMQPGELDRVKEQLLAAVEHFRNTLDTGPEHRYVAWLPAAVLVASGILRKHGILEFDPERLMLWSLEKAATRIGGRQIVTASEILSRFVSEHIGQCLMVAGPYTSSRLPVMVLNNMGNIPAKVLMRSERDTRRLYINANDFRAWCIKGGYSHGSVIRDLEKAGIALSTKLATLGAGTPAVTGRVMCLEIDTGHKDLSGELADATIKLVG